MLSSKTIGALLLLNLAVMAVLVLRPHPWPLFGKTAEPAAPEPTQVWITNTMTVTNLSRFHWSQLESEDYQSYVKNLRAIGCPEQTIRDIVIADLDLLWAPRIQSVVPQRGPLHYWECVDQERLNNYDPRDWRREERTVDWEKRQVLRELMGIDLVSERMKLSGKEDKVDARLQFLPVEKRMEVRDILERIHEEEWGVREKEWEEGTALTEEDRARLRQIHQQREEALNQLLSPQERSLYDLWMSDAANTVRHDMYGMEASEQEFLAVYNLRKQFDETWSPGEIDFSDPQAASRWELAKAQLDRQIQETLGAERFAAYQRGQDEDFHLLNRTLSRYDLPRENAALIYDFKRVLEEERRAVVLDANLSLAQKEAALAAMNDEAKIAVKTVLGENAYNYYRRKTSWLKP